jgi:hypothetical protein
MKYFLSFVTIQPNMSESTKDKNIKSLVLAKQGLLNNDLEEVVNQLNSIQDANVFFKTWIEQANYYIEVKSILNKVLK